MERNTRTSMQGVVVAKNNDKTITVLVSTKRNHALYAKRVGYSKKYYAHDEKNEAKVGDTVTIMACRPVSKMKRWRLVSIDQLAIEDNVKDIESRLEKEEGSAEVVADSKEEIPAETPVEEAKAEEAPAEEPKAEEEPKEVE